MAISRATRRLAISFQAREASGRFAGRLEGRGKRGGARIIYFFHSADFPLFVLTAFAKSERVDLSQKDRNSFQRLTKLLVETYRRPKR